MALLVIETEKYIIYNSFFVFVKFALSLLGVGSRVKVWEVSEVC